MHFPSNKLWKISVIIMDTLIFFCTLTGLFPIFVRSWRTKIYTYSIVMTTLGISLIILGALALTETYTEEEILILMKTMWNRKDLEVSSTRVELENFWNNVQMEYKCCGLNSSHTYYSDIPESCCASDVRPCTIDNIYRTYCFNAVKAYYANVLVIILVTATFTTSFVCLILIILAQFSKRVCGLSDMFENVSVL